MSALRSNIAETASVFCSTQEARDKPRTKTTESEDTLALDIIKQKRVIKKLKKCGSLIHSWKQRAVHWW